MDIHFMIRAKSLKFILIALNVQSFYVSPIHDAFVKAAHVEMFVWIISNAVAYIYLLSWIFMVETIAMFTIS